MKPTVKPNNPQFSSGPCTKFKGWNINLLQDALVGRSHRSSPGKEKLKEAIDLSREVLEIPEDYRIGIVPASDTGAIEMAMWNLLGPRGVDAIAWESFGSAWVSDILKQLKIDDVRCFEAPYGKLPNLSQTSSNRDIIFTWNGTTSGVKVPNADWIDSKREGLTICDATSAVFAMDIDWKKLDVVTWSWQKVMGGEAAHGIIVLSPRAVERLENYTPSWPLPKIFRLTKGKKLIEGIFKGETINTPSMICVEDAIIGLKWAKESGGLKSLIQKSQTNLDLIKDWVKNSNWAEFLCEEEGNISNTSICIKISNDWYNSLSSEDQTKKAKELVSILDKEKVALDIGSYRDAPAGIRIWGGATIENEDIKNLLPWLDWAYGQIS